MQDLPNGGGGAPLQALAPGRWRSSLHHWYRAYLRTSHTHTRIQTLQETVVAVNSLFANASLHNGTKTTYWQFPSLYIKTQ